MAYQNSRHVIQSWLEAVNDHDLNRLLSLYSDGSVLFPTFSPHTLKTAETRRRYFEMLTARSGLSVSLHEKTVHIQAVSEGVEIAGGIYRFHLEIDEEPLVFEARFSLTVDLRQERPILHHHSSQIPRTLS